MDFRPILAAAQRANAAYIDDKKAAAAAFFALGLRFIGQYQTDSCQAVLSISDATGIYNLSISGTRFSQGKLGDLFDDLDDSLIDIGAGDQQLVTCGAWDDLPMLWAWVKAQVPKTASLNVEGHSLGGWRARYTPSFLDSSRIVALHSFESPKGANLIYWTKYLPVLQEKLISVVNGRDLWVSWPFWHRDLCHPPLPAIWLQEDGYQVINPGQWPGGLLPSDHDMDTVVSRLAALVAKEAG